MTSGLDSLVSPASGYREPVLIMAETFGMAPLTAPLTQFSEVDQFELQKIRYMGTSFMNNTLHGTE